MSEQISTPVAPRLAVSPAARLLAEGVPGVVGVSGEMFATC